LVGGVAFAVALGLLAVFFREQPSAMRPSKPATTSRTTQEPGKWEANRDASAVADKVDETSEGEEPQGPIDVLALVDPAGGSVEGSWSFDGHALIASATGYGRFDTAVTLPSEYRIELDLERIVGDNAFSLGLVAAGRSFNVFIDGKRSEMTGVWGKEGSNSMVADAVRYGRVLANGRVSVFQCTVRPKRFKLTCDGNPLVDWPSDYSKAGLHEGVAISDQNTLTLGLWGSTFRIHRLVVVPLAPDDGAQSAASPPSAAN
jgi:hypothetical protein